MTEMHTVEHADGKDRRRPRSVRRQGVGLVGVQPARLTAVYQQRLDAQTVPPAVAALPDSPTRTPAHTKISAACRIPEPQGTDSNVHNGATATDNARSRTSSFREIHRTSVLTVFRELQTCSPISLSGSDTPIARDSPRLSSDTLHEFRAEAVLNPFSASQTDTGRSRTGALAADFPWTPGSLCLAPRVRRSG
jgi:hypothetical protein